MKFKVGKEIPTPKSLQQTCPKCKGILSPRNGSNSYHTFLLPTDPNASSNRWQCGKCGREFEVEYE